MAKQELSARYQEKDENGVAILDAEGQAVWTDVKCSYDFGETLDEAKDMFGADVVFSQFLSAAKVKIQSIMREKKKAGLTPEAIQAYLDTYKIGMVVERTPVNPFDAVRAAFATMTDEEKIEKLRSFGIEL